MTLFFAQIEMSEKIRFMLVFLMMVSIAISFSGTNLFGKYLDHNVWRFVGKISLPFYLNTNMIRYVMKLFGLNELRYRYFILIAIVSNAVLSSILVIVFEKLAAKRKERRK